MHCNQMEAAHPSSGAVMLVTNVSHKGSPAPPAPSSSSVPPPCITLLLLLLLAGGLYIPEESTDRRFCTTSRPARLAFWAHATRPHLQAFHCVEHFPLTEKQTGAFLSGCNRAGGQRRASEPSKASGQAT